MPKAVSTQSHYINHLYIYKSFIHTHLHGVTLHINNKDNKNHINNIKSTKKVVLPQSYIKALPSTQGIQ